MLKLPLVAEVREELVALRVYPLPALSSESVEKVATPATAATLAVPERDAPPGLVPMERVMVAVLLTGLLDASSTRTVTAGDRAAPAVALVGCCKNPSLAAAPATTVCDCAAGLVRPLLLERES